MEKKGSKSALILCFLVALLYEGIGAVALGGDCTAAACAAQNTECVDGTKLCACTDGYTQKDATCKANKGIGDACTAADNVCTTVGTACVAEGGSTSTTKCLCAGDYVANAGNTACLKKIDEDCTDANNCIANTVCSGSPTKCQCAADFTSNADKTKCLGNKEIGDACTVADNVCTTVGTACVADGGSTSTRKCLCTGDYVANTGTTACLKKLGTSCGSTTVCVGDGVCDTNSDSPTCAIGSGGTCDADSKCVANSKCTETKCTCSNGEADKTTKLCPSPSGGLRESSSMLVVTVCLWLSLF